ncbi:MAG: cyclic nucleotide-binding domain-containing protein [Nitrospinae bacterium]|nr:cyclic nucleotide-binding domain-containing protein [Nitrospinota bacterium]
MDNLKGLMLIENLAFFDGFRSEEKVEVASVAQNFVQYRKESLIVKQDSNDPSLYILLDGKVVLKKNHQPDVIISTLLPNSIFGTLPALPVAPRNKNVIAIDNSHILRVDRPMLDALNPIVINKFNIEFIKVLFRRVSEMNIKVSEERGEIGRIAHAFKKVKKEIDMTPSFSEETRIVSNFMYAQLKTFGNPL